MVTFVNDFILFVKNLKIVLLHFEEDCVCIVSTEIRRFRGYFELDSMNTRKRFFCFIFY